MCSIIGVGERLHKVLGQIDLGTLDSGERSLPFGLLVLSTNTIPRQSFILLYKYRNAGVIFAQRCFPDG